MLARIVLKSSRPRKGIVLFPWWRRTLETVRFAMTMSATLPLKERSPRSTSLDGVDRSTGFILIQSGVSGRTLTFLLRWEGTGFPPCSCRLLYLISYKSLSSLDKAGTQGVARKNICRTTELRYEMPHVSRAITRPRSGIRPGLGIPVCIVDAVLTRFSWKDDLQASDIEAF